MARSIARPRTSWLLLAALLAATGVRPAAAEEPWDLCGREADRFERVHQVPRHLLTAIARTESGRWHAERQASLAWPWTVMAEGKGRFLPSKAAAIAEVERLRAAGVRNIDVGCMQVNLMHHPKAFDSLEEAFEPARNVEYAGSFLLDLRQDHASWIRAIGYYHSRTPKLSNAYRRKVAHSWRDEQRRARDERRLERRAEQEARRDSQG